MRILFFTHRLPYAPNRGDRVRSFHILQHLRHTAEIDLVSLVHDADEAAHVNDLKETCNSVTAVNVPRARNAIRSVVSLPTATPLTHTMLDGPDLGDKVSQLARTRQPDVALFYCSGMARLAFHPALSAIPFVLDMVDVDSEKWRALAATSAIPRAWVYSREARVLADFERRAAQAAAATLVVTEKERATLLESAPGSRIEVIGNGVDVESLKPPVDAGRQPTVVFCGVMNYAPNEEGAVWLAREVWPLVRRQRADAKLQLVGSNPTAAVLALADNTAHVEVTGSVPDVRPFLWAASVSAAPLLVARGIQNKVLEALAAGLPAVVTPVVAEGLPVSVRAACAVAGNPRDFADAIVSRLNLDEHGRAQVVGSADLASLSWQRQLSPLEAILVEAAGSVRNDTHDRLTARPA